VILFTPRRLVCGQGVVNAGVMSDFLVTPEDVVAAVLRWMSCGAI
jgi:hypothetical protein